MKVIKGLGCCTWIHSEDFSDVTLEPNLLVSHDLPVSLNSPVSSYSHISPNSPYLNPMQLIHLICLFQIIHMLHLIIEHYLVFNAF